MGKGNIKIYFIKGIIVVLIPVPDKNGNFNDKIIFLVWN